MPCGKHLARPGQESDSLPSRPYWGYEDIAIFFALAALMNTAVRLGARFHVIAQSEITNPGVRLQFIIVLILSLGLYLTLKLRYHLPVVRALGWTAPSMRYTIIALAAGILSAAGVALYLRARHQTLPLGANMILLGSVLAPILEESLFRGFLLPVLARTAGNVWAVIGTGILFALIHGPTNVGHWLAFSAAGILYGWLRVASGTTTAAAILHGVYNLTLILLSGASWG
jgi:uncharacterized protein